jgi:hypothetical protein
MRTPRPFVPTNKSSQPSPSAASRPTPIAAGPRTSVADPSAAPPAAQPQQFAAESASSVKLRYLESSPVRVRGLVTGNSYHFSAAEPAQEIDARDAVSLLNTRFFRHA